MARFSSETDLSIITEDGRYILTEIVSIRGKILDAFVTALQGITQAAGYHVDVAYVSTALLISHPEELDKDKFPACFPIDDTEEKEGFAFDLETKSILTIIVTTILFDKWGETFDQRHALIMDIEKAIVTNTTLFDRTAGTGLLLEPASPRTIETDKGFFKTYSWFDQTFECLYVYDSVDGGA